MTFILCLSSLRRVRGLPCATESAVLSAIRVTFSIHIYIKLYIFCLQMKCSFPSCENKTYTLSYKNVTRILLKGCVKATSDRILKKWQALHAKKFVCGYFILVARVEMNFSISNSILNILWIFEVLKTGAAAHIFSFELIKSYLDIFRQVCQQNQ